MRKLPNIVAEHAKLVRFSAGIELSEELRKVRQKLYKLKDQEKDPAYPGGRCRAQAVALSGAPNEGGGALDHPG